MTDAAQPSIPADYEWDPSKSLATAWSNAASRMQRGRRAYGRRGGGGGKAAAAASSSGGGSAASGGGGAARNRKKRALRQRQMLERDEAALNLADLNEEGEATATATATATAERQASDPIIVERNSSVSSLGDASLNSSFDNFPPAAAAAARADSLSKLSMPPPLPPQPSHDGGGGGRRSYHSRSSSVSVSSASFPFRPPTMHRRNHQRSASASASTSSHRSSFASISSPETTERENSHPNLHNSGEDPMFSPVPPAKIKRIRSTPLPAAPPPKPPCAPSPLSKADVTPNDKKRGNRSRRKKTRTDEKIEPSIDEAVVQTTTTASPTQSSSCHSSTSFSSLSKTGDLAPTWVKNSLQECVAKWKSNSSSSNLQTSASEPQRLYHRQRGSIGSIGVDLGSFASPAKAPPAPAGGGAPPGPAYSSPARSLATACGSVGGSSRKRDACESPPAAGAGAAAALLDADYDACDLSSTGGLSSAHSSSACCAYRSRARSRIFSPDSTKKIMAAAAAAMTVDDGFFDSLGGRGSNHSHGARSACSRGVNKRTSQDRDDDSDSDGDGDDGGSDSDARSKDGLSAASSRDGAAGDHGSDSEDDDGKDDDGGYVDVSPPPRLSIRRTISDSFAESVFGAVDGSPNLRKTGNNRKRLPPLTRGTKKKAGAKATKSKPKPKEGDPLESISSYDDLKFLIKALRRSVRPGRTGMGSLSTAAAGVSMGCTIVIPHSWSSGRRGPFVTWVTKRLGFSLRSAGGSVSYLQATSEKARCVLASMEATLIEHKAKEVKKAKEKAAAVAAVEAAVAAPPPAIGSGEAAMPMKDLGCFSSKKKRANLPPETPLFIITAPDRLGANPCADIISPLDRDVDGDLLNTMNSLSIAERASSRGDSGSDTHFVRTVTLEPNQDSHHASALPCFRRGEMSVSPKDTSFEGRRPPRHSGEHSAVCGQDLMKHIHGVSPMDARDRLRPPRLAVPGRTPLNVPRLPPDGGGGGGGGGGGAAVHVPPPLCVNQTPSFDVAETPLPNTRESQVWGSRPIPGRDWGQSEKCDDGAIAVLVKRFEAACAEAELCGQSPMLNRTSPLGSDDGGGSGGSGAAADLASPPLYPSASCFVHPSLSQAAVSSSDLGFDFEADDDDDRDRDRPPPRLGGRAEEEADDISNQSVVAEEEGKDDDDDGDRDRFDEATERPRRHTCLGLESAGVPRPPSRSFIKGRVSRQGSVGATAFAGLRLGCGGEGEEDGPSPEKLDRRRQRSYAKHKRVSLCAAALETGRAPRLSAQRFTLGESRRSDFDLLQAQLDAVIEVNRAKLQSDRSPAFVRSLSVESSPTSLEDPSVEVLDGSKFLALVFGFLNEEELMCSASLVCSSWADAATYAHASLSLISVGCSTSFIDGRVGVDDCDPDGDESDDEEGGDGLVESENNSIAKSMERKWKFLTDKFPWAMFLSEGAYKRVYKVWNGSVEGEEAVSVMDVDIIEESGNKQIVGNELAMSVMLSSLVRRGICPNFVLTRGIFTCQYEPPASHWGCAENKRPKGSSYVPGQSIGRKPREPAAKNRGRFQYIRMELCRNGDVEEYIKEQPGQVIDPCEARNLLFQMAFSLHVAADRFGMKHYDVKLLNFFLQSANDCRNNVSKHPRTILRYGFGSHVFRLQMSTARALIAKLADYGTANMAPESNGQPVTLGQFTTLENSPPDFMLLGDAAKQGYGHDCFGLGLCMLHLFTGHAPYEEIMEEVRCPPSLKKKLRKIWEEASSRGYEVIRSVILSDVYEDEEGNIEGEPDEVLYDTLYRFLVLFGIPEEKFQMKEAGRVWRAITSTLEIKEINCHETKRPTRRTTRPKNGKETCLDAGQYARDCREYSLAHGMNPRIAAAREKLNMMDGGLELLLSLVSFDPNKRATPLDVINSTFMSPLREEPGMSLIEKSDIVHSFMSYATR